MPTFPVDDFNNLSLPDGTAVKEFGVHDLRRRLQSIGITDISPEIGWHDLCVRLRDWNKAQAAAADERRQRERNGFANQGEAIIADVKARSRA